MAEDERELYVDCIGKQLEEIQLLSSIYCGSGELQILDAACICDFEKFLNDKNSHAIDVLRTNLEFIIQLILNLNNTGMKEKIDVRIELPHLYPKLEHPIISIQSSLLPKNFTQYFKTKIENFIEEINDKQSPYLFQLITWIQEQIEEYILTSGSCNIDTRLGNNNLTQTNGDDLVDFERLWIYSHHIKAKSKRQEIVKQSRELNLTGFSRPGKPGIICVEGLRQNTQEFWSIIKSLHWQKINICKSEIKQLVARGKLNKLRRFEGFKEQLFCNNDDDDDDDNEDVVMDMGMFIKFLESHNSGYMKKELFGIE